jgi:hypothetical protein
MLTGSILALNFYSNPIEVLVGEDRTVYVNWDHFCRMISRDFDVPPHNLLEGPEGTPYIAFSYVATNIQDLVYGIAIPEYGQLIIEEFFGYVVKELALIRDILPMITMDYHVYDSGIFERNGKQYILESKIGNIVRGTIPNDVPRYPAFISVQQPITGMERFMLSTAGPKREVYPTAFATWLIDLSSLPYIIEASREQRVAFNSVIVPKDSKVGKLIRDSHPAQRFDSPGIVGTHSCELDPDQKAEVGKGLFQSDEPLTWAGSGLTLKSE